MHADPLEVRPARVADAAELAAVHVEGRSWAYRHLVPDELLDSDWIREERERMWARFVSEHRDRTTTLIAVQGGAGVGLVDAGPSRDEDAGPTTGEIYAIYLRRADLAGKGIGRALMKAALDALRGHGFTAATLWALSTNDRARAFYEAGGFRADGAEKVATLADVPLPHTRFRLDRL